MTRYVGHAELMLHFLTYVLLRFTRQPPIEVVPDEHVRLWLLLVLRLATVPALALAPTLSLNIAGTVVTAQLRTTRTLLQVFLFLAEVGWRGYHFLTEVLLLALLVMGLPWWLNSRIQGVVDKLKAGQRLLVDVALQLHLDLQLLLQIYELSHNVVHTHIQGIYPWNYGRNASAIQNLIDVGCLVKLVV